MIGKVVWMFDHTIRRYPPPPPGKSYSPGPPIYEAQWVPVEITGETRISWLAKRVGWREEHLKIPKNWSNPLFVRTRAEVDDDVWLQENRHTIVRRMEYGGLPKAEMVKLWRMLDAALPDLRP
jgi:hypothetical protein